MKKRILISALLVIALVGWMIQRHHQNIDRHDGVTAQPAATGQGCDVRQEKSCDQVPSSLSAPKQSSSGDEKSQILAPAPGATQANVSEELRPFQSMANVLSQAVFEDQTVEQLLTRLDSAKQKPIAAKQSDDDIGDMTVIRTESPIPGTRYFHAQYVNAANEKPHLQHMSFEFKPGAQAFENATAVLKTEFKIKEQAPSIVRPDFLQWNLEDGYVVWIKRMGSEDLGDDPFNAYRPEDVGTVRVAVEQDPHHGMDDDHHHGEDS